MNPTLGRDEVMDRALHRASAHPPHLDLGRATALVADCILELLPIADVARVALKTSPALGALLGAKPLTPLYAYIGLGLPSGRAPSIAGGRPESRSRRAGARRARRQHRDARVKGRVQHGDAAAAD